jgi:hydroxyacylglutathione hydrolase
MDLCALVAQLDRVPGYEPGGQRFESSPVHMILYVFPFGPLQTNTIFLACLKTKQAAVIDPAYHSTDTILKCASDGGFRIEKILLTHSHWDHFADAYRLKEITHADLFVHPLDQDNLKVPGVDRIPLFVKVPPVAFDCLIGDGDQIQVGDLSFVVIHTPGHSPGGVCYYAKSQNLLISGDTLFRGSMGSLSLPTADPDFMRSSLATLAALPSDTRVIPGHGEETTIGQEKWLRSFITLP